jgi:8-oxo-dGTP pyrophosphatase MutT (NUDIX family)
VNGAPPRAGTFTVRRKNGNSLRVLLVTAKRTGHWILPMGRIENGEKAPAAAARETEEEAGVRVTIGPKLGRITMDRRGVPGPVTFYLAEFVEKIEWEEGGEREREWVKLKEARSLLPEVFRPIAKAAIRQFEEE